METVKIIFLVLLGILLGLMICLLIFFSVDGSIFKSKRKEKYLKNKEKKIIEQLEFEKDIYVRKVKIKKRVYGYVFFTKFLGWNGKVYPRIFESLDELFDYIKKLEKKGKI